MARCTWCQRPNAAGSAICITCGRLLLTDLGSDRPLPQRARVSATKASEYRSWWNGGPFIFLGAAWIALGLVFWLHDRAGLDLWVAGVGVFVLLIGVGWRVALTRVFRAA